MDHSEIEPEKQFKERKRSHYIIYFIHVGMMTSYATLSSVWPFLNKLDPHAEKSFVGVITAAGFSGQMIFSVLMGYWSNKIKSTRRCFIFILSLRLLSLVLQANLEAFQTNRKYWYLFARLISGMSESGVTLCRSHISSSTLITEKRKAFSLLSSATSISYCFGPAIQYLLVPLGEKGFYLFGFIKLDMYTTAFWIFALHTIINLILMHPSIFVEHCVLKNIQPSTKTETYTTTYNYKFLAILFLLINYALSFDYIITLILGPVIAMDEFAMTRSEAVSLNSIIRTSCYLASFFIILTVDKLCKQFSEMKIFFIGFVFMYIGRICFYPFEHGPHIVYDDKNLTEGQEGIGCPLKQTWCTNDIKINYTLFILGNVIECVGFSFATTLIVTIFSKILGAKRQGTWLGFLSFSGGLARITSPLIVTSAYQIYGPSVTIIGTTIFFVITTTSLIKVVNCLLQHKNKPPDECKNIEENFISKK